MVDPLQDRIDKAALFASQMGVSVAPALTSAAAMRDLKSAIAQQEARKIEALRLYEPSPLQQPIHECTAKELLVSGGNRAGKSLAMFVETARAITGQDPHNKYPKRDGIAMVIGYKERHIGMVIHKYLFRAGAFRIIRDEQTKEWRTFRPWEPADVARQMECKPAPPLVPPRFIKSIVWKKKSERVFSQVELTTGWILYAFSSTTDPDSGFNAHYAHIDEDIVNEQWYMETVTRLIDFNGKLRWSALPHNDNDAMEQVAQRAEEERDEFERTGKKPSTILIELDSRENRYLPKEAVDEAVKRAMDAGEFERRILGRRNTNEIRMYPTWSQWVHGLSTYKGQINAAVDRIIDTMLIPEDWSRTVIVDPGHTVCACLFIATPPPAVGEFRIAFDELYIRQCTADIFGQELKKKFELFTIQRGIIDPHGGALRSLTDGRKPQQEYEARLRQHGIAFDKTGSRFELGCDEIKFREEKVRSWLAVGKTGRPTIFYIEQLCSNLHREMTNFKKKKVNGVIIDDGNRRANTHLVDTMEYAAADGLAYLAPKQRVLEETPAQKRIREFLARQSKRRGSASGAGVPLAAIGSG